jgi:hypothetical protein
MDRSRVVKCIIVFGITLTTCTLSYIGYIVGEQRGIHSKDIQPGDTMVELRDNTESVDVKSVNHICTVYYETTVYSTDGKPLRSIITKTEPEVIGDGIVTVRDGLYESKICTRDSTTVIISKKIMPISWLVNSMGETSYIGKKRSRYNYYLEGKRFVAPVWNEEWWDLMR